MGGHMEEMSRLREEVSPGGDIESEVCVCVCTRRGCSKRSETGTGHTRSMSVHIWVFFLTVSVSLNDMVTGRESEYERERERDGRVKNVVPITHKDAFVLWPEPSLSLTHTHTATHGVMELHPFSHLTYGFSGEGSCGDLKKKQLARH